MDFTLEQNRCDVFDSKLLHRAIFNNSGLLSHSSETEEYKTATWIIDNMDYFNIIVLGCLNETEACCGSVSLRGIIMQLIWEEMLPLNVPANEIMQIIIEQSCPLLKGKFKNHMKKESQINKDALLKLIDQFFDMQN